MTDDEINEMRADAALLRTIGRPHMSILIDALLAERERLTAARDYHAVAAAGTIDALLAERERLSAAHDYHAEQGATLHDQVVALTKERDALLAERDDLVQANHILTVSYVALRDELSLALDRISDMLDGNDGRAWKEAEKFLTRHRLQEGTQ